ncbi:MAG: amidohydrolase [Marinicaulis sp.]|nr:amidohydrolase [Marinicaulis sp.]
MHKRILVVTALVLTACEQPRHDSVVVDFVYENGVIWTGVPGTDDARVIAVDDGAIVHVGSKLPAHMTAENSIDLGGRFVMPGFMDNHVHFIEGGAALASVDLRDADTPEEFIKRIVDYAAALPRGRWVLNGNWDHTLWGGELPHKSWIDSQTADTPVYVIRIDGHMALANSAALKAAGVSAITPDPDGGEIVRDDEGEPTGILKGNALNLVLEVIPPPSDDELMEQFELAQDHALSLGLTKVHAVTAYPTETTMLDIFQMAQNRSLMKLRATVSTPIESWQEMKKEVEAGGTGDAQLSWGGVKGFIDGSLGARTAWLHEPYSDQAGHFGLPLNEPGTLKAWMTDADAAGLRLSVHALGDRGIDTVIDQLREIAGDDIKNRRYRIEHFQHPTEAAISDLVDAGIIASMQPYHAIDDGRWAEDRIGEGRLKTTYAFRSILDAGGILTFGSDWPVAPLSPIDGVYAAVTRRTLDNLNPDGWISDQKITVEEALTAYTATNAYSFGEEKTAGTLSVGKRADFVILSADPRSAAPHDLRQIAVLQTIIDGETVFAVDGE